MSRATNTFRQITHALELLEVSTGKKARRNLIRWCREILAARRGDLVELKVTLTEDEDVEGLYRFDVESRSVHGDYEDEPELAEELLAYQNVIALGMAVGGYIRVHCNSPALSYTPKED
jgi:hypothetical protein